MSPKEKIDLNTILKVVTEIINADGVQSLKLAKKLEIRLPSLDNHVYGLQGLQEDLANYGLEEL